MTFEDARKAPLEGEMNVHEVVTDEHGREFLKRFPKENPRILDRIAHEYAYLGFTALGGSFRRRSSEEQVRFATTAADAGLRVLPPSYVDERGIGYYRFLDGAQMLDEYLPAASDEEAQTVTFQLFDDLRRAHVQSIVYGDRWSHNMLVVPNRGVLQIDFDLAIEGRPARELDVAQAAFYTLCGGGDRVLQTLAGMLAMNETWYESRVAESFMLRMATYFENHPSYGIGAGPVTALFAAIRTRRSGLGVDAK